MFTHTKKKKERKKKANMWGKKKYVCTHTYVYILFNFQIWKCVKGIKREGGHPWDSY